MDFNDLSIQHKPSSENRCYTVQDLQDILGVGRKSVYSLLKRSAFHFESFIEVILKLALK